MVTLKEIAKQNKGKQGGSNAPAAKPAKLDLDVIEGGVSLTNNRLFVRMVKVKINNAPHHPIRGWMDGTNMTQGPKSIYTTNEKGKGRLINPQPSNAGIQGHDGHKWWTGN